MSSAYVPGLKVTDQIELKIERRLPLKGNVIVKKGDRVRWNTVVANTFLPGSVEIVNVAAKLGVAPGEVSRIMLKQEGDTVLKGDILASSKGFLGFFKSNILAPINGTVESVSDVSGLVVLRAASVPVEIKAYVDGIIEEILPEEGVIIKTVASYVQGIFGIGGETAGELFTFTDSAQEEMKIEKLSFEHKGKILVGGSLVTAEFLRRAVDIGVRAVIVGGISDADLADFLGFDLGVAITGSENKGITLIITEGFGTIAMAERTFALLKRYAGRWASVSGATQIRAGVIRPEIIVAKNEDEQVQFQEKASVAPCISGLRVGSRVRLIRDPDFGKLAKVTELPHEAQLIPTGAKVRVAKVELDDGRCLSLPRANLEIIEDH
ncbi:MAG: hypothetical protein ACI376_01895 [Candidatus Bruticola sp.]